MRWLIVNTEAFHPKGVKGNKEFKSLTKDFLPWVVRAFIHVFNYPYVILDESSKIKTNVAMPEHKKSLQCRTVKLLNDVGERSIMTGTLKSKSPLNVYDQYQFLDPRLVEEDMYSMAERYCIMETIRVGRGRRVQISQRDYDRVRTRLINAWNRDGQRGVDFCKSALFREFTLNDEAIEWIMSHKAYSPFVRQDELDRRFAHCTMRVKRSDVFDTTHEKYVHDPIVRYVEATKEQKKLMNELVELGFTESLTLGKGAALELFHRLQDVCNGFNPVLLSDPTDEDRVIRYDPLKESPKMDGLMELIDEIGPDENQIALFSSRTNFTGSIIKELEKAGVSYVQYGGTTKEKQEAERIFKAGKASIFLSNIQPSAYGLNSLAKCSYEIYACPDYKAEVFYQSTHRILRGQLEAPKFAYFVSVRNTIEERLIRSLRLGVDLISGVNDRETFLPPRE